MAVYAQRFVDDGLMVGTDVLVARRGRVVLRSTAGLADREAGAPGADDTLWRFYSMTKPITSVAVMQLVEAGRLRLRDPLHAFVPAFADTEVFVGGTAGRPETAPLTRPVTIADLLTHTAGLTYSFVQQHPVDEIYRRSGMDAMSGTGDLEATIDALAALPLRHQPGTRWSYSMATDVLGRVVEVVSDRPFAQYLQDHVLDPLGMVDTTFRVGDADLGRLAACYSPDPETLEPVLLDAPATSGLRSSSWSSGGGGLVSTTTDYMRFSLMLLNGGELDGVRILSPTTIELMTRNQMPRDNPERSPGQGFGLDFSVVLDPVASEFYSVGEYYWGGAAGTWFWIDPAEDLVFVGMIQQRGGRGRPNVRSISHRLTYQAIIEPLAQMEENE